MRYRHYGSSIFRPELIMPVVNEPYNTKPKNGGGFWGTPIDYEREWIEYCLDMEWNNRIDTHFDFDIAKSANIVKISDISDLNNLPKLEPIRDYAMASVYLDFEKMVKDGVDAIEVIMNNDLYWALFSWDVSSILVMNPEVILI